MASAKLIASFSAAAATFHSERGNRNGFLREWTVEVNTASLIAEKWWRGGEEEEEERKSGRELSSNPVHFS